MSNQNEAVSEIIDSQDEYTEATGMPYDFSPEEIDGPPLEEDKEYFYDPETMGLDNR